MISLPLCEGSHSVNFDMTSTVLYEITPRSVKSPTFYSDLYPYCVFYVTLIVMYEFTLLFLRDTTPNVHDITRLVCTFTHFVCLTSLNVCLTSHQWFMCDSAHICVWKHTHWYVWHHSHFCDIIHIFMYDITPIVCVTTFTCRHHTDCMWYHSNLL